MRGVRAMQSPEQGCNGSGERFVPSHASTFTVSLIPFVNVGAKHLFARFDEPMISSALARSDSERNRLARGTRIRIHTGLAEHDVAIEISTVATRNGRRDLVFAGLTRCGPIQ